MKVLNKLNFKFLEFFRTREELNKFLCFKGLTYDKSYKIIKYLKEIYKRTNSNSLNLNQLEQVSGGAIRLLSNEINTFSAEVNPLCDKGKIFLDGRTISLGELSHAQLKAIDTLRTTFLKSSQVNVPSYAEDKKTMDEVHKTLMFSKLVLPATVGLVLTAIITGAIFSSIE